MEATARPATPDLDQAVLAWLAQLDGEFRSHSFFQLVWKLQRMYPQAPDIGGPGPFGKEPLRFRANTSLAFPISDVEEFCQDKDFDKILMTVNFLGLIGPASPLPTHYSEEILASDSETSHVRHFLDMFHHRLTCFLYRAFEKYRYFFVYKDGGQDYFSNWMFSLIGIGDPQLRKFSSIRWSKLLPFINLLGMKAHSASTLEAVLSQYFNGIEIKIDECIGKMVSIDDSQWNQLGMRNCTLGQECLLGSRVFDRTASFKLAVGPLDYAHYRHFLPHGKFYRTLRELVQFIIKDQLAFDVELKLKGGQIPQLGLQNHNSCQLGCSAWLGERLVEEMVINQVGLA